MKRDYRFSRLAGSLVIGFLVMTIISQGAYAQEFEKKGSWGYFFPGFGAAAGGGSATG